MAREQATQNQNYAFEIAKQVVERSYPKDDVDTCNDLKKKYGQPLDVVAKINAFILHITRTQTRRAKIPKQNHILILVYMAI